MMVVTLVCAAITVPTAAGALLLLPPVFAQQQEETSLCDEEGDDFASGIVSNVLDGSGNNDEENDDGAVAGEEDGDDGDSNTQIAVPITDQDQREANLAEQLGLDADIVEVEEEEEVPPEEGVSFCYRAGEVVSCFPTELECLDTEPGDESSSASAAIAENCQ
jgi:hypothetical protein